MAETMKICTTPKFYIQPLEGFPFPRSYHVISFFLSICFKVLEEVVNGQGR